MGYFSAFSLTLTIVINLSRIRIIRSDFTSDPDLNNIPSAINTIGESQSPTVFVSQDDEDYSPDQFLSFEAGYTPHFVYSSKSVNWTIRRTRLHNNRTKFSPKQHKIIVTLSKFENQFEKVKLAIRLSIPNFDLFIFIGEEQILRQIFMEPAVDKLRYKVGVTTRHHSPEFLAESPTFCGCHEVLTKPPDLSRLALNGRILKVSGNTLQPFIVVQPDGSRTGGTHYMMLIYASQHYNFTLNWDISPTRGSGKKLPNGTTIGMLGDVLERGYDIAFISRLAEGQYGVIDLTTHNSVDTLVFVTRNPKTHLQWTAMIYVFHWDVWALLIGLTLGIIPIYFWILQSQNMFGHGRETQTWENLFKSFLIPYGLTVSQGVKRIPSRAYPLTAVWLFFTLILAIYYNSNLSAFLTFLSPEKVPQSFTELDLRPDYNVSFNYINEGACDCFHFFEKSLNPMLIRITNRFMINLQPSTAKCVINSALLDRTVCIGWDSVIKQGIASNATLYRQIHLVTLSQSIHISLNSIGFQRYSKFTTTFDRFIGMFRDMGVVTKLRENAEEQEIRIGKHWLQTHPKSHVLKSLNEIAENMYMTVKAFEIDNFYLSFTILILGLSLGLICFGIEVIFNMLVCKIGQGRKVKGIQLWKNPIIIWLRGQMKMLTGRVSTSKIILGNKYYTKQKQRMHITIKRDFKT